MNDFLKNLGLILVVIAAIVLVLSYFMGWNNINGVQFGAFGTMIVGVVLYVILNKKLQ